MAGKIEADSVEFFVEALDGRPGFRIRKRGIGDACATVIAEEIVLFAFTFLCRGIGRPKDEIDGGKHLRAMRIEAIEGACLG